MSGTVDCTTKCVVCGGSLMGKDYGNHHCDPKRLAKIESSQRASHEHRMPRQPSLYERLSIGSLINSFSGDD